MEKYICAETNTSFVSGKNDWYFIGNHAYSHQYNGASMVYQM